MLERRRSVVVAVDACRDGVEDCNVIRRQVTFNVAFGMGSVHVNGFSINPQSSSVVWYQRHHSQPGKNEDTLYKRIIIFIVMLSSLRSHVWSLPASSPSLT